MKRALLRTVPALLAAVLLAAVAVAVSNSASSRAAAATELLPDLEQEVPTGLEITRHARAPRWRLGFRSAVRNVGDGPLRITGRRPEPGVETMVADQVIEREGAPAEVGPARGAFVTCAPGTTGIGTCWASIATSSRRPGGRAVVTDRKSGFCLGDRYAVTGRDLPARVPKPVYRGRCGLDRPELLGIREGISVGYADDYVANLEGQWLPLDRLRAGRYLLVHRVNADGRLRERSHANNEASVLFRLRWRRGTPQATILADR